MCVRGTVSEGDELYVRGTVSESEGRHRTECVWCSDDLCAEVWETKWVLWSFQF